MSELQKLVILCGPTASGKSALAVDVARRLGGEIVSADSMQVYRGMDIGTAKPAAGEMGGVPHHLLDCVEIGEEFSAAAYRDRARACITNIIARRKLPILCGGTGLYIQATVYPLEFSQAQADESLRTELQAFVGQNGNEALHRRLQLLNPQSAQAIHPNNVKRVIRALEKAMNGSDQGPAKESERLFNGEPLYRLAWIGLSPDRAELYRRIEVRVDEMLARGLLQEVSDLAARYDRNAIAFQALGYKELLNHLDGKSSLAEAIEQIKQGTRNYAKRQMTWFKREQHIQWFDPGAYADGAALADAAVGYIRAALHMSE